MNNPGILKELNALSTEITKQIVEHITGSDYEITEGEPAAIEAHLDPNAVTPAVSATRNAIV